MSPTNKRHKQSGARGSKDFNNIKTDHDVINDTEENPKRVLQSDDNDDTFSAMPKDFAASVVPQPTVCSADQMMTMLTKLQEESDKKMDIMRKAMDNQATQNDKLLDQIRKDNETKLACLQEAQRQDKLTAQKALDARDEQHRRDVEVAQQRHEETLNQWQLQHEQSEAAVSGDCWSGDCWRHPCHLAAPDGFLSRG